MQKSSRRNHRARRAKKRQESVHATPDVFLGGRREKESPKLRKLGNHLCFFMARVFASRHKFGTAFFFSLSLWSTFLGTHGFWRSAGGRRRNTRGILIAPSLASSVGMQSRKHAQLSPPSSGVS